MIKGVFPYYHIGFILYYYFIIICGDHVFLSKVRRRICRFSPISKQNNPNVLNNSPVIFAKTSLLSS